MHTHGRAADRLVIGVDGGATKTTAVLAGLDGPALRRVEVGPTNVHSATDAAVADSLVALTDALRLDVDSRSAVAASVLGVAGAGRPGDAQRLTQIAQEAGVPGELFVTTDARVALHGATLGAPGVIVIAGTGSMCYGRDADGREARAGGWGHVLDDAGSAYGIGVAALRVVVRQADGRAERTRLLDAMLDAIPAATIDAVVPWIGSAPKSAVAALAPAVLATAALRDGAAAEIAERAAAELVALAGAVARRLRFPGCPPVALTGGLLGANDAYRDGVIRGLAEACPPMAYMRSQAEPAWGAVLLARDIAEGERARAE